MRAKSYFLAARCGWVAAMTLVVCFLVTETKYNRDIFNNAAARLNIAERDIHYIETDDSAMQYDNCEVSRKLQEIAVTVKTPRGTGSGTMVQRMIDGRVRTFVWTAAHVVASLRSEEDGVVTFGEPTILVETWFAGEMTESKEYACKVIRYSDADNGHDLALLAVKEPNVFPLSRSADFMREGWIPEISVELCHCGSLLGEVGTNSYTTGVLSKVGRMLEGLPYAFDQITVVTFPGSSGGGVHLRKDGRYVGMLVRGHRTQGFNLMVPVRAMYEWAREVDCLWALDDSQNVPSLYEINTAPVEVTRSMYMDGPMPKVIAYRSEQSTKGAIFYFGAPWCGACKRMQSEVLSRPEVKAALGEYAFYSLNADLEKILVAKYGVQMLPTMVVLDANGIEIGRQIGFVPAKQLLKWLATLDE